MSTEWDKCVLPPSEPTTVTQPRTGTPRRLNQSQEIACTAAYDPDILANLLPAEPQIITVWEPMWLCSPRGWVSRLVTRFEGYLSKFEPAGAEVLSEENEITVKITMEHEQAKK